MWLTTLNKMPNVSDYQQHQLLAGFFDTYDDGKDRPFCFRDTGEQLIVLSNVKPKTDSREITFKNAQTLMFECRASVRQRSYQGRLIKPQDFTASHLKEWFCRRLEKGAYVDYVTFKKLPPHKVRKSQNGQVMFFNQTLFYGTLTISNADEFDKLVGHGIGAGGAFGFGALILPQVMQ